MKFKLSLLSTLVLLGACAQTSTPSTSQSTAVNNSVAVMQQDLTRVQAIPAPTDMVADVVTNARVSTVNHIDVAYVGKQIPFTFSDGKVDNTEGFDWYVSKHFALKTDYPAERAKFFLELLELSYPYYVEYFGMEPANIDQQRIASTYATSNDKLRTAMFDDGFNRGIHHTAGGEAMYYNWVGYSFPTERPQHQRYIAIHETMHSYQMALGNYPWTPSWHGEGLGDSAANHNFNSKKKQLTVFGHDVPIFDMMSWGLASYKKYQQPTIVDIHNRKRFDRGLNVLFTQFMYNNPEYSQYMKVYHQEIMRLQTDSRAKSLEVLQAVVPDWAELERNFAAWVADIDETHVVASRGQWEMDGNMFYKRKSNYDYAPQRVGFTMTPAEQPSYRPFMIDFPSPDASDLLLPAKRGVEQPTLAYLLTYKKASLAQGKLGMSLGVKSTQENSQAKAKDYRGWKGANTDLDEQLRIEVSAASSLIIDARNLNGEKRVVDLPSDISASLAKQAEPELGVSITITKQQLVITVKADDAKTFVVKEPISPEQYDALVNRNFGLVSSDNQHGITPYIDDGRDLNPNKADYSQQTAANAWGFKGDKLAQRFARANWKAGKQTPQSWRDAFNRLNKAALSPKTADSEIKAVVASMAKLAADGAKLNNALVELSGVQLQVDWLGASTKALKQYAIITNHSQEDVQAKVSFTVAGTQSAETSVAIKAGEKQTVLVPESLLAKGKMVSTRLNYQWHKQAITQQIEQKTKKYNGYQLASIDGSYQDDNFTVNAMLHGPFAGKTQGEITIDLYHSGKKESASEKFSIKPYQELAFNHKFNVTEKELEHDAWYEVSVVAEVDGEPVLVRKRLPYVPAKFNR
ncbi:hypothetical protein [Litorilituus sediminis]|uniref:Peptidase M60 domain-containing protein n=1 Tax=Litorilituus sediminis TaxID=718192 RepID=A0A4P6P6K5_9GAMM|nr:hypothetical protein [Litorilituus sediminis]QBG37356.1 hypothetical protein EMK97_17225 [Litorilituus sediminis]